MPSSTQTQTQPQQRAALAAQPPGFDPQQFIINAVITAMMFTNVIRSQGHYQSGNTPLFFLYAAFAGFSAAFLVQRITRHKN